MKADRERNAIEKTWKTFVAHQIRLPLDSVRADRRRSLITTIEL